MKQKTKSEKFASSEPKLFFSVILAIVLIPMLAIMISMIVQESGNDKTTSGDCAQEFTDSVKVSTDKVKYNANDKIFISVINHSNYSIYFEPCNSLGAFEKKTGNDWMLEDNEGDQEEYSNIAFERQDGAAKCEIGFPKSGPGIYRLVIPIFYECKQPSRYACQRSEIFYSNEFEVIEKSSNVVDDTICNQKIISECKGKKIAVMGVLNIKENSYTLTDVSGIKIDDSFGGAINLHGVEKFSNSLINNMYYFVSGTVSDISDCASGKCAQNVPIVLLEVDDIRVAATDI